MTPLPNDEHQEIVGELDTVLRPAIGWQGLGKVRPGVNVSDRTDDWTKNYRCPDVAVFLNATQATNVSSYWLGGPDFLIEVASPGDDPREKVHFYSTVGVREMLVVDRDPWSLDLLRLEEGKLKAIGQSDSASGLFLVSTIHPLQFRLQVDSPRPRIEVTSTQSGQKLLV